MNRILFMALLGAMLVFGCVQPTPPAQGTATPSPTPVACTMEAKLCPDGSVVGRTGPNCEFAPCPKAS